MTERTYKYVLNPGDQSPRREPVAFTTCHSFSREPLKVAYHAAEHEYYKCTEATDIWPYTFEIQSAKGKTLGRFVVDIVTELEFEVGVEEPVNPKPEVPDAPEQMALFDDG